MQLVACIKFYFLLLGRYILLFALAEDSIVLDDSVVKPTFRGLVVRGKLMYGSDSTSPPTSTILGNTETVVKMEVESTTYVADMVNDFPDLYVGADGGSKLYFGDLQYQTYIVRFATKSIENVVGGFTNRSKLLMGVGTVDENNYFVGKVGDYDVYNKYDIFFVITANEVTIVGISTQRISYTDSTWRPVIIVDDNTTVTVTETHSEMKVWYLPNKMIATSIDASLKKVELSVGAGGNSRTIVTSQGDTFCLGIVKTVERGSNRNVSRFVQGYFSDGESLWTNPNYAAIALHAQRRTSLIIDLQVTDEETLMTVWREGSKSGIRLKVNAIDATGFKHEIWAIYKERSPIVETTTTALIPETLVHMCLGNRSCPYDYQCIMTADNEIQFHAGMCHVTYHYMGEATFYSEYHLITYGDGQGTTAYDYIKRRRMSSNSRHVPPWFFHKRCTTDEFVTEDHTSVSGYV